MERRGIISSLREETTLPTGNQWRIHYWRLEKEKIIRNTFKNQSETSQKISSQQAYEHLYATIPKDSWMGRKQPVS